MVAWGLTPDGEEDVVVFAGRGHWEDGVLTVRREPEETSFVIRTEWIPRIRPVPPEVKDTLLGADYHFSVTVGDIGEDRSALDLVRGLKWPPESAE